MTKTSADMYLYEALELRAEYQGRLASLKALVREKIRTLEYKSRKLNNAIQQINFTNEIEERDTV